MFLGNLSCFSVYILYVIIVSEMYLYDTNLLNFWISPLFLVQDICNVKQKISLCFQFLLYAFVSAYSFFSNISN